MAASDYLLCDNCDAKALYDPGLDLNATTYGDIHILCSTCTDAGYKLLIADPTVTIEPQENP